MTMTETPVRLPRGPRLIDLDLSDVMSADEIEEASVPTRSPMRDQLERLWEATREGQVPLDDSGEPKFVAINRYKSPAGAQTALKSLKKKANRVPGDPNAWQFRRVVKIVDGQMVSELRARYIGAA